MDIKIKRWILGSTAVLTLIILHPGCNNRSLNPDDQTLRITDIKNTIWTLDKPGYEPFQLLFNEEGFFGYDGCNWFGGRYEAQSDSLFPKEVTQTQRSCQARVYPVEVLAKPFLIQITSNQLRLLASQVRLTFKSSVNKPVENSPLIGNWQLTASTDPAFAQMQAQELIPLLSFNEDREFSMTWYCVPENTFGCDEVFGLFGIGAKKKILFYQTGWKNHAPGSDFAARILNASSYHIEANGLKSFILTLTNTDHRTHYVFSAVRK